MFSEKKVFHLKIGAGYTVEKMSTDGIKNTHPPHTVENQYIIGLAAVYRTA